MEEDDGTCCLKKIPNNLLPDRQNDGESSVLTRDRNLVRSGASNEWNGNHKPLAFARDGSCRVAPAAGFGAKPKKTIVSSKSHIDCSIVAL
jgi:hypothetical protein